jgi:hypothetical protein
MLRVTTTPAWVELPLRLALLSSLSCGGTNGVAGSTGSSEGVAEAEGETTSNGSEDGGSSGSESAGGETGDTGTGETGESGGTDGTTGGADDPAASCFVDPVVVPPEDVVQTLSLDPFYEQYLDAGGLAIVASSRVEPDALRVACEIAQHMLTRRPDVRAELISNHIRIGVMAQDEVTTDMPEHSDLYQVWPSIDWDTRARGLGATLARPLSSVGEENLLHLPGDVYDGESIMVHEFAHTFWVTGVALLPTTGVDDEAALAARYQAAIAAGTWSETYAETNEQEYWAEAVQSYYDTNLFSDPANGVHGPIDDESALLAADPQMHALIAQFFERDAWVVP